MKFIDLFAGVGGFRRGMELAGHECVGFCEWDKYASASYRSMHTITEEQREYLATLDLKKRQKEILKDEYLNGEWYADDIRTVDAGSIPRADCYCFGAPCQDFSVAGHRAGLEGDRSSLVREVFRIIGDLREEDRPEWLIYENVKGMLSSNRGFDFLAILLEMDELGYDTEWQLFNSKDWGVPQNRERVYTVGHLRSKDTAKVFPIEGTDGEDRVQVMGGIGDINFGSQWRQGNRIYDGTQIATALAAQPVGNAAGQTNLYGVPVNQIGRQPGTNRDNPNQGRVYAPEGVAPSLNCMEGGGREPHIPIQIEAHYPSGNQKNAIFGIGGGGKNTNRNGLQTAVFCSSTDAIGNTGPSEAGMNGNCYFSEGVNPSVDIIDIAYQGQDGHARVYENTCPTLSARDYKEPRTVAIPVLTPDRAEKTSERQTVQRRR